MTNKQAIMYLTRLKDRINFEVTDAQGKIDALNMAIQALQAEEDLISRQVAIKHFREGWQEVFDKDEICYELEYELPSVAI